MLGRGVYATYMAICNAMTKEKIKLFFYASLLAALALKHTETYHLWELPILQKKIISGGITYWAKQRYPDLLNCASGGE